MGSPLPRGLAGADELTSWFEALAVRSDPPPGYEMLLFADANVGASHGYAARFALANQEDPDPFFFGNQGWPWVNYTIANGVSR